MSTAIALEALRLFPLDGLLCAGGLRNILYAFGLGYGASMMANSFVILAPRLRDLLTIGGPALGAQQLPIAGGVLFFAYGLRLATFLWRRQADASYGSKLSDVQAKSDGMPLVAKASITAFVALSQSFYAMPLLLSCETALKLAPETAGVPLGAWSALAVSASGLLLEAVADEQKLAAKRLDPTAPCTSGLYARCRHPNYSGEILFHLGMWGLTAGAPLPTRLLSMGSQGFMTWVMVGAANRLDADGQKKYGERPKYREWRARTGRLLPRLGTVKASTA